MQSWESEPFLAWEWVLTLKDHVLSFQDLQKSSAIKGKAVKEALLPALGTDGVGFLQTDAPNPQSIPITPFVLKLLFMFSISTTWTFPKGKLQYI